MDKKFKIQFTFGKQDFNQIIDDLAQSIVIKSVNEYKYGSLKTKKIITYGQTVNRTKSKGIA